VAILLPVDQYATVVHASGHRYFSGDIRRVSHLALGNGHPLHIQQDARAVVFNPGIAISTMRGSFKSIVVSR
jgi:hypothetical protein